MYGVEYLAILRKRWLYVVVPALLGLVLAGGLSYSSTPTYQATASVYFSLPYAATANDLFQGSNYTQKQLSSYASLATMPVVLSPVIAKMRLTNSVKALGAQISAVSSSDTVIIDIQATDPSPATAAALANNVADELGVVVKDLSPKDAAGKSQIDVRTVAIASAPSTPNTPKTARNLAAGGLGGLFLGLLLAIARDKFDTRVRSIRDVHGAPGLASIAFDRAAKKSPLIVGASIRSVRAEAFRQLRTNLQFVRVDDPVKVVVITSSVASEGKSITAANLAAMFAEAGRKVLLIEADLRRPRVSDYLGLERSVGLTNVLAGQVAVDEVLQSWGGGGLTVLPSGSIPPNPSELLGSQNMADLLATMRTRFDMVIVDTPPLLPVTDAAVLAVQTDGAVVVVRYGRTTRSQVASGLQSLHSVDARVLGAVLNMVPAKGADAAVAYDGYGYYEDDPASGPPLEGVQGTKQTTLRKSRRNGSGGSAATGALADSDDGDNSEESGLPHWGRHGAALRAKAIARHHDAARKPTDDETDRSGLPNPVDSESTRGSDGRLRSDGGQESKGSSWQDDAVPDDETSSESLNGINGAVRDAPSLDESNASRQSTTAAAVNDHGTFSADHNDVVVNDAQPTLNVDRRSGTDHGQDQSAMSSGGADRDGAARSVGTMNGPLNGTAANDDSDQARSRRRRRRR